jgi:hypothetical protein
MQRKAQAALDFLVTYGWAFIALTLVIAALYFMSGTNSPNKVVSDSCTFSDNFICKDYQITKSGHVTLNMKNTVGTNILVNSTYCSQAGNQVVVQNGIDVPSGGDFQLTCDIGAQSKGKVRFDVTIIYFKQSMSFPSTSDGLVISVPIEG